MYGPAPPGGGRPAAVTLSCGHQLDHPADDHPYPRPGSSLRCPTCTVASTVSLVESSPTLFGQSSWEYDENAPRHRILVFDDGEEF